MSPVCGTQKKHCFRGAAGDRQGLARTGHVGHHRGRTPEQEIEQLVLHGFREVAERCEQAERGGGLVGRLQGQHALAHRHQPLERMLDSDGQQDGRDAEPVAERDVPRLTQIERGLRRPPFWGTMRDLNASSIQGHKELIA
jgi:hypothetical protein